MASDDWTYERLLRACLEPTPGLDPPRFVRLVVAYTGSDGVEVSHTVQTPTPLTLVEALKGLEAVGLRPSTAPDEEG
jgi:hypothetical protein